jgi:hypothetical protein
LAEALRPLLADGVERAAQLAAFEELVVLMKVDARQPPSDNAAESIERIARKRVVASARKAHPS